MRVAVTGCARSTRSAPQGDVPDRLDWRAVFARHCGCRRTRTGSHLTRGAHAIDVSFLGAPRQVGAGDERDFAVMTTNRAGSRPLEAWPIDGLRRREAMLHGLGIGPFRTHVDRDADIQLIRRLVERCSSGVSSVASSNATPTRSP